jgi:hypothetical protein
MPFVWRVKYRNDAASPRKTRTKKLASIYAAPSRPGRPGLNQRSLSDVSWSRNSCVCWGAHSDQPWADRVPGGRTNERLLSGVKQTMPGRHGMSAPAWKLR